MTRRTSFIVVVQQRTPRGETYSMRKVYDASPEEQRRLLNRAIVGYDPHHIDAPGELDMKFQPLEKRYE